MTVTGENPTCYNYSDGAVTINATGGNGGNEYSISDSTGAIMTWYSGTPNTLVWGWYYCYVIDDMGCELFDSVYLENPGELQPIVYFTDPSSLAACDGIATVDTVLNHQGGYSGIAYFWDPGGPDGIGQNVKSDLCNEYFTLIVNDSIGCWVMAELSMGSASVTTNESESLLMIFPNPFTESTSIQIERSLIGETMFIYNQLGVLVRTLLIQNEQTTIYKEQLSPGFYYIRVGNYQGELILE